MRLTRLAPRAALATVMLLALGACDYFGGTASEEAGDASGEVLEGSISDGMIPTDDLTSQPPALRVQPGEGGAADVGGADSAVEGEAADPAAEVAPAEPEAAAE